MSAFGFRRDSGERSCEEWRALDRALYRWVRAHGGSALLAATAAWVGLADGDGDAALPLAGANRLGMAPLSTAEIELLRAEPMVADADADTAHPFVIDRAQRFYLWRNHAQEYAAAAALRARREPAIEVAADAAIDADLDTLFDSDGRVEVQAQRLAVRSVIGRRLFVLTGGPGTGKTTTILRMLLMLQRRAQRPLAIRIAAPTGKAAQRLAQALRQGKRELQQRAAALPADWQALLDGVPDDNALTMHRLLGYQPWRNGFRHGAHDPIAADVVVVDEASMIDLAMLRALLDAVKPESTLILVGDADQLTSVATGSVLMDIVAALEVGAGGDLVRLQHSFRAERDLAALNDAVRRGDGDGVSAAAAAAGRRIVVHPVESSRQLRSRLSAWASALATEEDLRPRLSGSPTAVADPVDTARTALDALARRQLLCALREGPFGALAINALLERTLRKEWNVADSTLWYSGRAIMITHNDYAAGLFNGDVGLCLADAHGQLRVWFEAAPDARAGAASGLRSFVPNMLPVHETAFAITIHKSQGSEYDHVAVLLPPDADNRILSRQLLYTAVSRARQHVELWTCTAALSAALARPIERVGALRERLA
jgi:exodeoxyribonuclease V alpha subunit